MQKHLNSLPLKEIKIDDLFWNKYTKTISDGLYYQWETLNDRIPDAEKSYCMHNFKVAAGMETGPFGGHVFQDSDVAKWLESVAFFLEIHSDPKLEAIADGAIDIIGKAQQPDGYLDTYYILNGLDKRFNCIRDAHELYCAGHFMEAATAYYNATGKDKLLKIICRLADLICDVFGDKPGQLSAYPGHPEIEVGLVKLYRVTGEKRYLELAKFFVDRRGTKPDYFAEEAARPTYTPPFANIDPEVFCSSYYQNHLPIREQKTAEGHAVRNQYLFSGVADIAAEYQDETLLKACETIFENISKRRMYITGSIGSAERGEKFSSDYDLPNHSNYSESCASIALAMFCKRMLEITRESKYADIMERALYNTVTGGISLSGNRFFYVNPLEVIPEVAEGNINLRHVKTERQKWFGCACCPPNIMRTLASLGQYVYSVGPDELFVNLYVQNQTSTQVGERTVSLEMKTNYPFDSSVSVSVSSDHEKPFALALRVPQFASLKSATVDGQTAASPEIKNGYLMLSRSWDGMHQIELEFDMPAKLVYSNPLVRSDVGKVAVVKGPIVYCLEEIDNGKNLGAFEISKNAVLKEVYDPELFGGTVTIEADAVKIVLPDTDALYFSEQPQKKPAKLKFVPYCYWNNRGKGEMLVWVRCETK